MYIYIYVYTYLYVYIYIYIQIKYDLPAANDPSRNGTHRIESGNIISRRGTIMKG
jgi:hypothetical protein